jgi:acyl-CoA thioesterase-2
MIGAVFGSRKELGTSSEGAAVGSDLAGIELTGLLALEQLEQDFYRSTVVFGEPYALYGGQVAAQALMAAGLTVPDGRLPHSLHGYFLRGGDAARPTVFRVDRDRDGRSYSARRVVAIQAGEVIFNMSASFHRPEDGPDVQAAPAPEVADPDELTPFVLPRLFSVEGRLPAQPYGAGMWPTRFWARSRLPFSGPLAHACVLTYLSDISTGLGPLERGRASSGASVDHSVWFHRPVRMDEWVLMDLVPVSVAGGRGLYTGSVYARDGVLLASLAQEALFRPIRD